MYIYLFVYLFVFFFDCCKTKTVVVKIPELFLFPCGNPAIWTKFDFKISSGTGGSANFIAENAAALTALMELHPLRLAALPSASNM